MRKIILIVIAWAIALPSFGQGLGKNYYWISLTDKNYNEHSLFSPSTFLSERAIERRKRQNISITENDLPVSRYYIDSLQRMGLQIKGTSRWFNAVIAQSTDSLLLDTLSRINFITSVRSCCPSAESEYSLSSRFIVSETGKSGVTTFPVEQVTR